MTDDVGTNPDNSQPKSMTNKSNLNKGENQRADKTEQDPSFNISDEILSIKDR